MRLGRAFRQRRRTLPGSPTPVLSLCEETLACPPGPRAGACSSSSILGDDVLVRVPSLTWARSRRAESRSGHGSATCQPWRWSAVVGVYAYRRQREALEAVGPLGVGDVAGERGDLAILAFDAFEPRDLDAYLCRCSTLAPSSSPIPHLEGRLARPRPESAAGGDTLLEQLRATSSVEARVEVDDL